MMVIQGLYKTKTNWGGCHHLLLVYDALKLSNVYVVKSPVLGLQQAPENSEFAPSVQFSLPQVSKKDDEEHCFLK